MADWENKYKTSSPEFVKNQLKCFQSLYDRVSNDFIKFGISLNLRNIAEPCLSRFETCLLVTSFKVIQDLICESAKTYAFKFLELHWPNLSWFTNMTTKAFLYLSVHD
jgi:hypothetical protein